MLGQAHARRKYQAARIDPAFVRLAAQIGGRGGVARREPENAAGYLSQQPHPDVEHGREDLVRAVEAAKDETLLGQGAGAAIGGSSHRTPGVARAIAVRKVEKALGEKRLLRRR